MATYREKLMDPRWQRRRLEAMSRAGFRCERCATDTETLHVHHRAYIRGAAPWEYPLSGLMSLCNECHGVEQKKVDDLADAIIQAEFLDLDELIGFVRGYSLKCSDDDGRVLVENADQIRGMALSLGVKPRELFSMVKDASVTRLSLNELLFSGLDS